MESPLLGRSSLLDSEVPGRSDFLSLGLGYGNEPDLTAAVVENWLLLLRFGTAGESGGVFNAKVRAGPAGSEGDGA